MSELIRYRYVQGERYPFVQQIDIVVEAPGNPVVHDHAVVEGALEAVERRDDSSVVLRLRTAVTEQVKLTPPLPAENAEFRLSRRGELLEAAPGPPPVPFITFPVEPIVTKKAWTTVEPILGRPVDMTHTLAGVETFEGERVAHIVTEGASEGVPAIEYRATRMFGIARGRPVLQRSITTYAFPELGTTTVVVEERAAPPR